MKTLLVLAEHPDFAEAVRAAVNPEQYPCDFSLQRG